MFRVSDRTPPLLAAYDGTLGIDWTPWTLAMLMTEPPWPEARMAAGRTRDMRKVPRRLTPRMRSQTSTGVSSTR